MSVFYVPYHVLCGINLTSASSNYILFDGYSLSSVSFKVLPVPISYLLIILSPHHPIVTVLLGVFFNMRNCLINYFSIDGK